jgi:4-hydroxybenzoate polyprenyltransferase
MLALQASIGALNDLVDVSIDAGRKVAKPIPAGLISPGSARAVVIVAAAVGLVLAAPSGIGLVALAGLGLAIGYGYDLVAKGTRWSWVPFALGLPLLPVFGWFGAAGVLPASFAIMLPAAFLAGAALAIANALADADRDRAAGAASVAVWLGPGRARAAAAALHVIVALIALASLALAGAGGPVILAAAAAISVVIAGLGLGRSSSAVRLERAWEVQAIGIATLAGAWLWGIARPG